MKKAEECLFSIRMPGALVKRLDKEAERAQRSRSAEIRFRLESSLKVTKPRKASGGVA
ncbi:MAG: TraY domain-containing protein [Hydrogenophaga sp.]|nr:TraY domain-containing protein [Hydrogenophaga sp.]